MTQAVIKMTNQYRQAVMEPSNMKEEKGLSWHSGIHNQYTTIVVDLNFM